MEAEPAAVSKGGKKDDAEILNPILDNQKAGEAFDRAAIREAARQTGRTEAETRRLYGH